VLPDLPVPVPGVQGREARVCEEVPVSGAASRRKGSRAEVAVVHALRRAGWDADTSRNVLDGRRTGDDIVWGGPASIEVKDVAKMDLSAWLRQAQENAGDRVGVVVHKKRGTADAEGWYCTLTFGDLLRLIGE
jgi:hypothetical protein